MNEQVQNLHAVGIGDPMPRHVGVQRVDGVDVAQLLREIGEASAQESSVELFRLCLGAQRVLQGMLGFAHEMNIRLNEVKGVVE